MTLLFRYYGILVKRQLTLPNTVKGKPTSKLATFKKFRLVLSKRGINSKRQSSVLLLSVKIYKKRITDGFKTNPKIFLYNVTDQHVSLRISKNSD